MLCDSRSQDQLNVHGALFIAFIFNNDAVPKYSCYLKYFQNSLLYINLKLLDHFKLFRTGKSMKN